MDLAFDEQIEAWEDSFRQALIELGNSLRAGNEPAFTASFISSAKSISENLLVSWPEAAGPQDSLVLLSEDIEAHLRYYSEEHNADFVGVTVTTDSAATSVPYTLLYDLSLGLKLPIPNNDFTPDLALWVGYTLLESRELDRLNSEKLKKETELVTEQTLLKLQIWQKNFSHTLASIAADLIQGIADPLGLGNVLRALNSLLRQSRIMNISVRQAQKGTVDLPQRSAEVRSETQRMHEAIKQQLSNASLPEQVRATLRQSLKKLRNASGDKPVTIPERGIKSAIARLVMDKPSLSGEKMALVAKATSATAKDTPKTKVVAGSNIAKSTAAGITESLKAAVAIPIQTEGKKVSPVTAPVQKIDMASKGEKLTARAVTANSPATKPVLASKTERVPAVITQGDGKKAPVAKKADFQAVASEPSKPDASAKIKTPAAIDVKSSVIAKVFSVEAVAGETAVRQSSAENRVNPVRSGIRTGAIQSEDVANSARIAMPAGEVAKGQHKGTETTKKSTGPKSETRVEPTKTEIQADAPKTEIRIEAPHYQETPRSEQLPHDASRREIVRQEATNTVQSRVDTPKTEASKAETRPKPPKTETKPEPPKAETNQPVQQPGTAKSEQPSAEIPLAQHQADTSAHTAQTHVATPPSPKENLGPPTHDIASEKQVAASEIPVSPPNEAQVQNRDQNNSPASEANPNIQNSDSAAELKLASEAEQTKSFKDVADHVCGPNCPIHGNVPQAVADTTREIGSEDIFGTTDTMPNAAEIDQSKSFKDAAGHVCGPNCPIHGGAPQAAADQSLEIGSDDIFGVASGDFSPVTPKVDANRNIKPEELHVK